MAERVRFLVMYDIRHPGRLRRVHEIATDHGERLQYSVYVCDLTRQELVHLRRRLKTAMKLSEDSVSIFDLGPLASRRQVGVEHIGRRILDEDGDDPAVVW